MRNALAAGRGELTYGKSTWPVRLQPVEDDGVKEAVLRAFPVEVPNGVSFFRRLGVVGSDSPEEFAAAAPQCAVFHVTRGGSR